ncbi:MAG: cysteine hydrolase [Candidatus Korobacteraceae bacterium]
MPDRKLNANKTALLILELQNDVIAADGAFASSGAPAHADKQKLVANVKRLADAMRSAGGTVVHVHYIVEPGAPGLKQNAPLYRGVLSNNALVRGTRGAAPVPGLEPKPGDFLVEKMRMNAFYGTRLDPILQGRGIETLVITGSWTNFSVEHTARHGADAGYEIVLATDGTSTIDDEWQNAATNYALREIADRLTCDEILRALGTSA